MQQSMPSLEAQRQILAEGAGPSPAVRKHQKFMPDLACAVASKINVIAGSVGHNACRQVGCLPVSWDPDSILESSRPVSQMFARNVLWKILKQKRPPRAGGVSIISFGLAVTRLQGSGLMSVHKLDSAYPIRNLDGADATGAAGLEVPVSDLPSNGGWQRLKVVPSALWLSLPCNSTGEQLQT